MFKILIKDIFKRAYFTCTAYVNEQGTGDHIDKTHNDTGLY